MLIVFLLIVGVGLAGFALVFMSALKANDRPESVSLRPLDMLPRSADPSSVSSAADFSSDEHAQIVELKAVCEASELKIAKLEQMINEKNKTITDLQKGIQSGDDQATQIENLKQILQAEIEELKQQNKQLKADLARSSEENLDLQTKVYAGEVSKGFSADHMEIRPVISTAASDKMDSLKPQEDKGSPSESEAPSRTLSLHDVFGDEEEKEKKG